MATFDTPILTNAGIQMINQEIAGQIQLKFTRVTFASDDYTSTSDSDIANLTSLQNEPISATAQSWLANGTTKIRGFGYNTGLNQAFYIKSYGLYGQAANGTEVLLAVAVAQNADYMPSFNGKQLSELAYTFALQISSTANITFDDMHDVAVTYADLDLKANKSDVNNSLASVVSTVNNSIQPQLSSLSTQEKNDIASLATNVSSHAGSISSLNTNTVTDNHDGTITFNGTTRLIYKTLSGNEDIFKLAPGTYKSLWGYQNSLTNFPSPDGSATIFVYGSERVDNGIKIMVIDSWGNQYLTQWANTAFTPWETAVHRADITSLSSVSQSLANSVANNSISIASNAASIATNSNAITGNTQYIKAVEYDKNAKEYSTSHASDVSSLQSEISSNAIIVNNLPETVKQAVPNNDAWDNYTASGTYPLNGINLNSIADGLGLPVISSFWGELTVFQRPNDTLQIITDSQGHQVFMRAVHQAWTVFANKDDVNNLKNSIDVSGLNTGTIDYHTDLNQLTTPGTYWCNYTVPINAPSQMSDSVYPRFKIIVTSPMGGIAHQTIYLMDGAGTQGLPSLYVRSTYSGSSWNSWQAFTDDGSFVALQNQLNGVLARQSTVTTPLNSMISQLNGDSSPTVVALYQFIQQIASGINQNVSSQMYSNLQITTTAGVSISSATYTWSNNQIVLNGSINYGSISNTNGTVLYINLPTGLGFTSFTILDSNLSPYFTTSYTPTSGGYWQLCINTNGNHFGTINLNNSAIQLNS